MVLRQPREIGRIPELALRDPDPREGPVLDEGLGGNRDKRPAPCLEQGSGLDRHGAPDAMAAGDELGQS